MDKAAGAVRAVQKLENRADPLQPQFDRAVLVAQRVQEADRIWVWRAQRVSLKIAMVAKAEILSGRFVFSAPPRV